MSNNSTNVQKKSSLAEDNFSPTETLLAWLVALTDEQTEPPQVIGEYLIRALKALPRIAEALETTPDYSQLLESQIEAINNLAEAIRAAGTILPISTNGDAPVKIWAKGGVEISTPIIHKMPRKRGVKTGAQHVTIQN